MRGDTMPIKKSVHAVQVKYEVIDSDFTPILSRPRVW